MTTIVLLDNILGMDRQYSGDFVYSQKKYTEFTNHAGEQYILTDVGASDDHYKVLRWLQEGPVSFHPDPKQLMELDEEYLGYLCRIGEKFEVWLVHASGVMEPYAPSLGAMGSGGPFALGAVVTCGDIPTPAKVMAGLKAAEALDKGTGMGFDLIDLRTGEKI